MFYGVSQSAWFDFNQHHKMKKQFDRPSDVARNFKRSEP